MHSNDTHLHLIKQTNRNYCLLIFKYYTLLQEKAY